MITIEDTLGGLYKVNNAKFNVDYQIKRIILSPYTKIKIDFTL